jgi:hypothetical protein
MKRRRLFDLVAACGFVLIGLCTHAQDSFRFRATVDSTAGTGFYAIRLSPELISRSKASLSDLRLRDTQGHFVPYVLTLRYPGTDDTGYQEIPDPLFHQKDSSDRHSYLELEWPEAYRVGMLSLTVSEPVLYKRMVRICAEEPGAGFSQVEACVIDPHNTVLSLPDVKSRRLRIDIANADNAPLKIKKVSALQAVVFILSYLQGASSYEVLTGNEEAAAPEYDLRFFTDSLTRQPRELYVGDIRELRPAAVAPPRVAHGEKTGTVRNTVLLWGCLLVVLLFLIYFSIRMVKAIGKKDAHDRL